MISSRYNHPGRSPPASSIALGTTPAEPVNGTDSSCSERSPCLFEPKTECNGSCLGWPSRRPRRSRPPPAPLRTVSSLSATASPTMESSAGLLRAAPRPHRTTGWAGSRMVRVMPSYFFYRRRARCGRGPGIQLRDRRGPVRVGGTGPPHRCARPGRPSHWPRGGQPERTRRLLHRRQRSERALRGGAARRHPASARRNRHRKRRDRHRPVGARGTEALRARRHAGHRKAPGSQVARGGHGRQRDRANGRVQRRAPTDRGRPRIAARHRCRHRQLQRPVR